MNPTILATIGLLIIPSVGQESGADPSEGCVAARELGQRAQALLAKDDRSDAIEAYRDAVLEWELCAGSDALETAASLEKLGIQLYITGEYDESQSALERALHIRETSLGPGHLATADSKLQLGWALNLGGDAEQALPLIEDAVQIRERSLGAENLSTVHALNDLGVVLHAAGRDDEAEVVFRRALAVRRVKLGAAHPKTAVVRSNLMRSLQALGRLEEQIELLEEFLIDLDEEFGPDDLQLAAPMLELGRAHYELNHFEAAVGACKRALAIRQQSLGKEHPLTVAVQFSLVSTLEAWARYDEALLVAQDLAEITVRTFGATDRRSIWAMNNAARLHVRIGEFERAVLGFEEVIRLWDKTLGPDSALAATARVQLADVQLDLGRFKEALSNSEIALKVHRRVLDPGHEQLVTTLHVMSRSIDRALGDNDARIALLEEALGIQEEITGPSHPDTASILRSLGLAVEARGDLPSSRLILERALIIDEQSWGPDHPVTAMTVNCLAGVLQEQGELAAARSLRERSLAISERSLGQEHPETVAALMNLAMLLGEQGDDEEALALSQRSVAINRKALGPNHPDTIHGLAQTASTLFDLKRFDEARPLQEEVVRVREETLGKKHPLTAVATHTLVNTLAGQGNSEEALALCVEQLPIHEEVFGLDHFGTAFVLDSLASLLMTRGRHEEARPFLERSLAIREASLDRGHEDTSRSRTNLAMCLIDQGAVAEAWDLVCQSVASVSADIDSLLWSMTEHERMQYAGSKLWTIHAQLGLARLLGSDDARRQAYQTVLDWKGQIFRSLAAGGSPAREGATPKTKALLDDLASIRTRLSRAVHGHDRSVNEREISDSIDGLRNDRKRIERELRKTLGASTQAEATSLSSIQAALPPDSALVDFFVHPWYEPAPRDPEGALSRKGEWTGPHVSAWIVRSGEGGPIHVDLGPSAVIESTVADYLAGIVGQGVRPDLSSERGVAILGEPGGGRAHSISGALWTPLAPHLEGVGTVFVSPDRFLGTLPFEIVPAEGGSYLIERHAFVYLQDAVALVTMATARSSAEGGGLLCVGNVDYREAADPVPSNSGIELGLSNLRKALADRWTPLPGTLEECTAISELHDRTFGESEQRLWLNGMLATEERLKAELSGFRIAHIATHGFFQPEALPSSWEQSRERTGSSDVRRSHLTGMLPGLLSGLVLAGANSPASGGEDGFLTAEELSFLDLRSLELIVLSACETGLGRAEGGEGMLGLRRTLRQSGARTVVSSLWSVDDRATSRLMQDFYRGLWVDGKPKLEALRTAQLAMLRRNRAEHGGEARPSTWGAFVLDGDWR